MLSRRNALPSDGWTIRQHGTRMEGDRMPASGKDSLSLKGPDTPTNDGS